MFPRLNPSGQIPLAHARMDVLYRPNSFFPAAGSKGVGIKQHKIVEKIPITFKLIPDEEITFGNSAGHRSDGSL